jgi:hypothetical protein
LQEKEEEKEEEGEAEEGEVVFSFKAEQTEGPLLVQLMLSW